MMNELQKRTSRAFFVFIIHHFSLLLEDDKLEYGKKSGNSGGGTGDQISARHQGAA